MRIISRAPFRDAATNYPNDAQALDNTYRILKHGNFETPDALKATLPSLDNFKYRNRWWVIDIGGNNLRLLAAINFGKQIVFVKHIATHSDYDRLTKYYRENKD